MALTPEQFAQLQAIVAQKTQAPQGAIQQAQGAPMPMQGMPPQGMPQGMPQRPPQAAPAQPLPQGAPVDPKQAVLAKVAQLPPRSQQIFKQKLQEAAAAKGKKK